MDKVHILKLGNVEIGVFTKGAELYSYKINGEEFIWDRNPEFWEGSSPVLFPFIGIIKDGKYTYGNKEYEVTTRHGFARDYNFELIEKGEDFLKFKFSSNEETLKKYPFEFDFFIIYTIKENSLEIKYEVVNRNSEIMYFSLGAHPAFALELNNGINLNNYFLEFEKEETAQIYKLEKSLVLSEKYDYLKNEKIIKLTDTIFDNDALIFKNTESKEVAIKCNKSSKKITVNYEGFPYVAFWSKPSAPFVCIEPWYGISDFADFNGKLEEKKGIEKLGGNETFTARLFIIGTL
ncbi:aldose 1-epimerase family protein [Leptotrichia sp. OH3620_COT-345]|uniref:aldose 1-epimerase family protein n=1 Tax=Leptotrichia sp. OH3620_COT-345 TaxID=2491048 RepID=UPI000F654943|nr:aldose 1-epimerase family protein [Leptotrichia sp. OH3620_COT-345]RRD40256.1 aldose 1-epimerase family protein [Leptotrichia sp. OH3620_COT-345]